jgi:hypothetical protein
MYGDGAASRRCKMECDRQLCRNTHIGKDERGQWAHGRTWRRTECPEIAIQAYTSTEGDKLRWKTRGYRIRVATNQLAVPTVTALTVLYSRQKVSAEGSRAHAERRVAEISRRGSSSARICIPCGRFLRGMGTGYQKGGRESNRRQPQDVGANDQRIRYDCVWDTGWPKIER